MGPRYPFKKYRNNRNMKGFPSSTRSIFCHFATLAAWTRSSSQSEHHSFLGVLWLGVAALEVVEAVVGGEKKMENSTSQGWTPKIMEWGGWWKRWIFPISTWGAFLGEPAAWEWHLPTYTGKANTVDGSEIRRSPVEAGRHEKTWIFIHPNGGAVWDCWNHRQ